MIRPSFHGQTMYTHTTLLPFAALLILLQTLVISSISPQSSLDVSDRQRYEQLFQLSSVQVTESSLATIHHSLVGLNVLHANNLNAAFRSTADKTGLCNKIKALLQSKPADLSIESIYHATDSIRLLASCQPTNLVALIQRLESEQAKPQATVADLLRSSESLINLGKKLDSVKVSKLLDSALAKDDSLLSTGFGLQLASRLSPVELLTPFVSRIPTIVARADQVEHAGQRYLQFEGGLGVTASIVSGIFSLATAANKPIGLKSEQVTLFTNYFLNRRTVQSVKGASELLQVLHTLTDNKYYVPIVVGSVEGNQQINKRQPVLTVKISNVLGQSLGRQFKVELEGVEETSTSGKLSLQPVQGDSTLYAIDLYAQSLPVGVNTFAIQVQPTKPEVRLVLPTDAKMTVVIQDELTLENVEIGVGGKEQLVLTYEPINFPARLDEPLEADYTQKIGIQFNIRNERTGKHVLPQQVFLQFRLADETKRSKVTTFFADYEKSTATYRSTINLAIRGKDFDYVAGKYQFHVLVGDHSAANAIEYHVADVLLDLQQDFATVPRLKPWMRPEFAPQPEIVHTFRTAEKRPSPLVTQIFTVLVLLPLPILFVVWFKLGVNLSAFRFSLSAILFHSSLALIFVLYTLFFAYLNMFTTIKCLSGVLLLAFLSGHRLLSSLAKKNAVGS